MENTKAMHKDQKLQNKKKENNKIKLENSKMRLETSGITLIALVVTIVVLLILAGITINYVMGDNGIFKKAQEAKQRAEIAEEREKLELVITDWWLSKTINPNIGLEELWEKLKAANIITSKEENVTGPEKIGEDDVYTVKTENGFTVEIIVKPNGSIEIGEIFKNGTQVKVVKVKSIEVTNTTTNSITVEVTIENLANGKISYYYKKEEETQYHELAEKQDTTDLTVTYTGLEQGKVYNIKVVAQSKGKVSQLEINAPVGELALGTISQKGNTVWENGKASIEVQTAESLGAGIVIQYQVGGIDEDKWKTYEGKIGELNSGTTIYVRLWDGTNGSEEAMIYIEDGNAPNAAVIDLSKTEVPINTQVTAVVTLSDAESGVNLSQSKWKFDTTASILDVESTIWNLATTFSSNAIPSFEPTSSGTYYLHVLTVDNAGNKTANISRAITVKQLVTSITVTAPVSPAKVEQGKTIQLNATVEPTNAQDKTVIWSSDNPNIATVNQTGEVTGVARGTATITATANDTSGVKGICSVTVMDEIDAEWAVLAEVAKQIAQDNTISNDDLQVRAEVNEKTYYIEVGNTYRVRYDGEIKNVRVLGFKQDRLADTRAYGTGTNANTAGISFEFVDFMTGENLMGMNEEDTNEGGWVATKMRKDLNGYTTNSEVQTGKVGGLAAKLSNSEYIKQVVKQYIPTYNVAITRECQDYLWLLAESEILNYSNGGYNGVTPDGLQYKYYKQIVELSNGGAPELIKKPNQTGAATNWWLRTPARSHKTHFTFINESGYSSYYYMTGDLYGVAPGFAI